PVHLPSVPFIRPLSADSALPSAANFHGGGPCRDALGTLPRPARPTSMMPGCAALAWDFAAPGAANFHSAEPCCVESGTLPRPRQEGAMRCTAAPAPAAPPWLGRVLRGGPDVTTQYQACLARQAPRRDEPRSHRKRNTFIHERRSGRGTFGSAKNAARPGNPPPRSPRLRVSRNSASLSEPGALRVTRSRGERGERGGARSARAPAAATAHPRGTPHAQSR